MKTCTRCLVEKPIGDFNAKQRGARCRSCCSEVHRQWVADHPERARELRRASAARKADEIRSRDRERRRALPEHGVWKGMQSRCFNPNCDHYPSYGGRGITVADEWRGKGGFARFFAHVGPRPSPAHSIDRYPNNDGNYEPGNVRWATLEEQARNTRQNRRVEVDGKSVCVTDAAAIVGMDCNTLRQRLDRGLPSEVALSRPVRPLERLITVNGVTRSAKEWSLELGGTCALVSGRIFAGWNEVEAASTPLGARTRWKGRAA